MCLNHTGREGGESWKPSIEHGGGLLFQRQREGRRIRLKMARQEVKNPVITARADPLQINAALAHTGREYDCVCMLFVCVWEGKESEATYLSHQHSALISEQIHAWETSHCCNMAEPSLSYSLLPAPLHTLAHTQPSARTFTQPAAREVSGAVSLALITDWKKTFASAEQFLEAKGRGGWHQVPLGGK